MLFAIVSSNSTMSWLTRLSCRRKSRKRVLAHVAAVEHDRADLRIVEPRQQAHERRLAAAGLAHERERRASGHGEAHVAQHRALARVVAERHAAVLDVAARARDRPRARVLLARLVERLKKLVAAAMPRCTTALTLISRFSGASNMPIAVMKPMNDGASRSENDQYMTAATPSATSTA